ncbi:MAG: hypothetical protein NZ700_09870 [Gemmataceae bacterium]|nr:hypothetical protein [Gemmataceae bacterium]MDW8264893.1 hypothetical protein [Gemmataceae bacterium]
MSRASLRVVGVLGLGIGLLCLAAEPRVGGADAKEVVIPADPLELATGAPLSLRTPVLRPQTLPIARSWTWETRRHRGTLYAVDVSPDGKLLATGALDGMIHLWDASTGQLVRVLVGHNSYVYAVQFSPDGKTLASAGSHDATARLWEVASGHPLRVFRHKGYVLTVAWSHDGRVLATSSTNSGVFTLWDVLSGKQVHEMELGQPIHSLSWTPNDTTVALGCTQLSTRLWQRGSGKNTTLLEQPGNTTLAVAWSPDGRILAAGGLSTTELWDASGKKITSIPGRSNCLAWSPDGRWLAVGSTAVHILDVTTGKPIKTLPTGARQLAWSADGKQLWAASTSDRLVGWDMPAGAPERIIDAAGGERPYWTPGHALAYSVHERLVTLWDITTGKRTHVIDGHPGTVLANALSQSGNTLATSSTDKIVRLWNTSTGALTQTLAEHTDVVSALAWSPDGRLLATGGKDRIVRLWNPLTGTLVRTLKGHLKEVTALAFSPNGSLLASGAGDGTRLWGLPAGQPLREVPTQIPTVMAFSPDGKILACASAEGHIQLVNPSNGEIRTVLVQLGSPRAVYALAFSPDGNYLATGNANHVVWVWNLRTNKQHFSITDMAPVHHVAWSRSGTVLVAGSADRSLRTWDFGSKDLRATVVVDNHGLLAIGATGYYRVPPGAEADLVGVVQVSRGQQMLTPEELAAKFRWKNVPAQVVLTGK